MGASWECFCFILKTLGARDQQVSAYVIVSTLLFLLAPLCKSLLHHIFTIVTYAC